MTRLGLTLPFEGVPLSRHADWLRESEDLGYTDLWTREVAGPDAFTPLAFAAACTRRARLGTAIAGAFQRGPALLAMEAAALAEAAPGRFVLGVGASSPAIVEDWNAGVFARPRTRMRDTLRFLRRALAGERIDEAYESFAVRGFRLERPPERPPSLHLAALGPGMLGLAGAEADGVLLGLLGAADVPRVLEEVRRARAPDRPLDVGLRIGVFVGADRTRAESAIRRILAAYLTSPAYARFHAWLGHGARLQPLWDAWRTGDRRAAVAAVPDDWIDRLFVLGSPERCRERIREFVEAGVTTPVLSLMGSAEAGRAALRALAPAAAG